MRSTDPVYRSEHESLERRVKRLEDERWDRSGREFVFVLVLLVAVFVVANVLIALFERISDLEQLVK